MAGNQTTGCRLQISGIVLGIRDWATKDNPPQAKRTVTVGWLGGHYDVNVDAGDPAFAKLGEGQEVSVSVPFNQHPKFGWGPRGAHTLLKGGAA